MINIGCDIGKSDFDVYFLGKHRKFSNNSEGINKFLAMCSKNTDVRVVLEPTGGYEKQLMLDKYMNKSSICCELFAETDRFLQTVHNKY